MHAGASTHTSVEKTINIYFEVNCISYVVTEFLGNRQIRFEFFTTTAPTSGGS